MLGALRRDYQAAQVVVVNRIFIRTGLSDQVIDYHEIRVRGAARVQQCVVATEFLRCFDIDEQLKLVRLEPLPGNFNQMLN